MDVNDVVIAIVNFIILGVLICCGIYIFFDARKQGKSIISAIIWLLIAIFTPIIGIFIFFMYREKGWL